MCVCELFFVFYFQSSTHFEGDHIMDIFQREDIFSELASAKTLACQGL